MLSISEIYKKLYKAFGPQHWWPGENWLEISIGAILTQNTAWRNVEKAISRLKNKGCLEIECLLNIDMEELAELIKPAGFYRQKAIYIKNFIKWIKERTIDSLKTQDIEALRKELLKIKGIGPETADSILLYAFSRKTFIIDAYTRRIFSRIGLIRGNEGYEKLRKWVINQMEADIKTYQEFHALLVKLGKEHCWKHKPLCQTCPLKGECKWHLQFS